MESQHTKEKCVVKSPRYVAGQDCDGAQDQVVKSSFAPYRISDALKAWALVLWLLTTVIETQVTKDCLSSRVFPSFRAEPKFEGVGIHTVPHIALMRVSSLLCAETPLSEALAPCIFSMLSSGLYTLKMLLFRPQHHLFSLQFPHL